MIAGSMEPSNFNLKVLGWKCLPISEDANAVILPFTSMVGVLYST